MSVKPFKNQLNLFNIGKNTNIDNPNIYIFVKEVKEVDMLKKLLLVAIAEWEEEAKKTATDIDDLAVSVIKALIDKL